MILNTSTAHLVYSITPPNRTVMVLRSSTHYLVEKVEENLCHTAVLTKFLPLNKPKFLLGLFPNLVEHFLNTNKVISKYLALSADLEAHTHKVLKLQINKILALNLLVLSPMEKAMPAPSGLVQVILRL
jgi:hypothetical protein